jgi:hypothetical protein
MKYIKSIYSLLIIVASSFLFQYCGDESVKETDRVQKLLTAGTWTMQSVMVGGVNKNELFTFFTINFSAGGFTSTDGAPVWPANGTWSFSDEQGKSILRDDGITVTLDEITETSLTFSMTWDQTTLGSGKVKSVAGSHTFVMSK